MLIILFIADCDSARASQNLDYGLSAGFYFIERSYAFVRALPEDGNAASFSQCLLHGQGRD